VDTLAARVLRVEHRLYPATVAAIAQRLRGGTGNEDAEESVGDGPGEVFRLAPSIDGLVSDMIVLTAM
jgi:hypothetical protein